MLPPISPPALSWLLSKMNSDGHETKSFGLWFSVPPDEQPLSSRACSSEASANRPTQTIDRSCALAECSWSRAVCRVIVSSRCCCEQVASKTGLRGGCM